MGPCLPWRSVSTTCAIPMLRNHRKSKHVSMFPQYNLTHEGLIVLINDKVLPSIKAREDCLYPDYPRADSKFASSQWETVLLCNDVSHWLDASLEQATGLDAWASRVKCLARFVSHLHEICIYIWVVHSLCFFCCLFITVTWWYVWCFEWASGNQEEVQACLVTLWLSYHATVYTIPL